MRYFILSTMLFFGLQVMATVLSEDVSAPRESAETVSTSSETKSFFETRSMEDLQKMIEPDSSLWPTADESSREPSAVSAGG